MAVWFMRWLRCADTIQTADGVAVTIGNDVVARLPGEEVTLFRAEIATDAARMRTPTKIVETTCCTRDNVRMR